MKQFRAADLLSPLVIFPAVKMSLHALTLRGYGVFRDELYYVACSDRLSAGYVDHPPLSIFVLRGIREIFGDGLLPMRVASAILGVVTLLAIGLLTRRLGGGAIAQSLAMAAFLASPIFWFLGHFYSMNSFDALFWVVSAYVLIEALGVGQDRGAETEGPVGGNRKWLLLGLVLGLGLLNKISVLWLGLGIAVGLLMTRERRHFKTFGPWIAGGTAALVFLPHVGWQIATGWPTLEFISNATQNKMVSVSPLTFVAGQLELVGGWIGGLFVLVGLAGFFFDVQARKVSVLGWMYLTVFLVLMINGASRAGYLAPAYGWVWPVAAWVVERRLKGLSARVAGLLAVVMILALLLRGAVALPFTLPILEVEQYQAYARTLGVEPSTSERKELGALPQHYADMFGWREKVRAARGAFEGLNPAEAETACFMAFNYGVAGALENEALALGTDPGGTDPGGRALPPVVSGHNNYWLWGPGACTGEVLIVFGSDLEELSQHFDRVERVDTVRCDLCMPYENHQPVFVARGPKTPLAEAWPMLKHYD